MVVVVEFHYGHRIVRFKNVVKRSILSGTHEILPIGYVGVNGNCLGFREINVWAISFISGQL